MADETSQRALFNLLKAHFQDGTSFSKEDILKATKWSKKTLHTYESKMFGPLLSLQKNGTLKVNDSFQRFSRWRDFRRLVAQNRIATEFASYGHEVFLAPVIFEFFLPFANELALRGALDSLFYRERILRKLRSCKLGQFKEAWPKDLSSDDYYSELARLVDKKFGGYSIVSASGRFRAASLMTQDQAIDVQKSGDPYLIDETTAIVRFICPIAAPEEVAIVRLLFSCLFVQAVLDVVVNEAEVWVLESGAESKLHIWRRSES